MRSGVKILRQEIYAEDGTPQAASIRTRSRERNYEVRLIKQRGG